MKKVGIIAEFNPFHNGHKYIIEQARKISGADYMIIAMSGDFVQRGTPAFMDKFSRTRAALENGADLVLMMPIGVSTSSAEGFANGAVKMLYEAGVDTIAFGIEGDTSLIEKLTAIADNLSDESPSFKEALAAELKKGLNFPAARTLALAKTTDLSEESLAMAELPNNQLAIEYIKAIKRQKLDIEVLAIPRVDHGYHSSQTDGEFASASKIRDLIIGADSYDELEYAHSFIPDYRITEFLSDNNTLLDNFVLQALLEMASDTRLGRKNEKYKKILDLTDDLRDRIESLIPKYKAFNQFADLVKNKSVTLTRVKRVLIHILLRITKDDVKISYLRILGIRKGAQDLISQIKDNTGLPIILQMTDARGLEDEVAELFEKDVYASEIYRCLICGEKDDYSRRFLAI